MLRAPRNMLNRGDIMGFRWGERGKWLIPEEEIDRFKKEGLSKKLIDKVGSSAEDIQRHDMRKFRESDKIMNEKQFRYLLHCLQYEREYSLSQPGPLARFYKFFVLRSNRYAHPELRESLDSLIKPLRLLAFFMMLNFIKKEKTPIFGEQRARLKRDLRSSTTIAPITFSEGVEELERLVDMNRETYGKYRDAIKRILVI
jgi:hypothetical protein